MNERKESEYSKKLRDPRWQKMRLEILQRDDWQCRSCNAKDRTLHVHHRAYEWGLEPWDYQPEALVTLCETCHAEESDGQRDADAMAVYALRVHSGFTNYGMEVFASHLASLPVDSKKEFGFDFLSALEMLCRLAHAPGGLRRGGTVLAHLSAEMEDDDPELKRNMRSLFGGKANSGEA